MLSDLRVLELSAPQTMLAGQIFGDLGADVIAIEPPGGSAGRRLGPYVGGEPGLERSLTWHALNRNKRGVTVDVASPDGRAILQALMDRADVLIEAVDGTSAVEGLRPPEDLVICNISPFSRNGPKANYRATDAVLMAAGGAPALAGPPDRPPLFFPVPQAMMEAGAEAAVAALSALMAKDRYGGGQVVELQARIATMPAALGRLVSAHSGDRLPGREPPRRVGAMPAVPGVYETSDGYAVITVGFAPAFVAMTQRMATWLVEEGLLDPRVAALDLLATARSVASGEAPADPIEQLLSALIAACRSKTKVEVAELAQRHRFMAAPIMTMADISAFEHAHQRGLFASQMVGDHTVEAPARFAQFSNYEIEVRRPAPRLSEHTVEVLTTFAGLSQLEIQALFAQGVV